jgi:hypothetical protein
MIIAEVLMYSSHLARHLEPDPPLIARVPAVGHLLGEEGPAQHRHAGADALERGVPAAVAEEPTGGAVLQHGLLVTPPDRHPAPGNGILKHRRQRPPTAVAHHVWSDHPEERAADICQPPCELVHPLPHHHRDAPEVNVHHRGLITGMTVQPRPQAGHLRAEGPHGEGVGEAREDGVMRTPLEAVEGVEEDAVGGGGVQLALLDVDGQHGVVGVRSWRRAPGSMQGSSPPGCPGTRC